MSEDCKTVSVGPGNDRTGLTCIRVWSRTGSPLLEGRLGIVGVPGGGVSFFGNEYGWVSANIANYTVCISLPQSPDGEDTSEVVRPGQWQNGHRMATLSRAPRTISFATIPIMHSVAYNSSLFYNSKEKSPGEPAAVEEHPRQVRLGPSAYRPDAKRVEGCLAFGLSSLNLSVELYSVYHV